MASRRSTTRPALVWFRQDLRLSDHAALLAAAEGGRPVVPVYVLDDEAAGPWRWGGASRWWLHGSLRSLAEGLAGLGAPLVLRRGRAAAILPALLAETGAEALHAGRMHEPWGRDQERELAAALPEGALRLHRTATLFEPDAIRTKTGGTYGVYGPFARAARARGEPDPPRDAPERLAGLAGVAGDELDDWGLLPTRPDWAGGFRERWRPGEAAARERLARFAGKALHGYDTGRNRPGEDGTSMLSAALHWGEVSPRQVWQAATAARGEGSGRDVYLGEILWREFSAYLLWHNPRMPEEPMRPRFAGLPNRTAPAELRAWQRGRTGVPIVDAGMRQLWHLGWMHNRVRMITASFLVKHLLIGWREGEDHFWDTLVDADLATNAASWQWITGSGIDSQPWFRVFNPVSQGEKFDPDGAYVRRWVPELARVPDRWVHAPWTAPARQLGGVRIGQDYPAPVVDLARGRDRCLQAYRSAVRDPAREDA